VRCLLLLCSMEQVFVIPPVSLILLRHLQVKRGFQSNEATDRRAAATHPVQLLCGSQQQIINSNLRAHHAQPGHVSNP
jgi:hypothetical protein